MINSNSKFTLYPIFLASLVYTNKVVWAMIMGHPANSANPFKVLMLRRLPSFSLDSLHSKIRFSDLITLYFVFTIWHTKCLSLLGTLVIRSEISQWACLSVRQSVGLSVIIFLKGGKFHFHAPIRVLLLLRIDFKFQHYHFKFI